MTTLASSVMSMPHTMALALRQVAPDQFRMFMKRIEYWLHYSSVFVVLQGSQVMFARATLIAVRYLRTKS